MLSSCSHTPGGSMAETESISLRFRLSSVLKSPPSTVFFSALYSSVSFWMVLT